MFIFLLTVGCLVLTVESKIGCDFWKNHENLHLLHSDGDCGLDKINNIPSEMRPRILHGDPIKFGSVPWNAYLKLNYGGDVKECSGTVINDWYIMTAAHCVVRKPEVTVLLGLSNKVFANNENVEKYRVNETIIHPMFDTNNSVRNDIALLRLDRRISFESPRINYVCLPTTCELARKTFRGQSLTVAGWGNILLDKGSTFLMETELTVKNCTSYKRQNRTYRPAVTMVCAESSVAGTCHGDSGGPLFYRSGGRAFQVGVVSFGPKNCNLQNPTNPTQYFTRVSSYMIWILQNIRQ